MAHIVCPVWVGYCLASPLRRLLHTPEDVLGSHVRAGMIALDIGPALGYFSLPLARMVGPEGRVVCVDVQERMLQLLRERTAKAGLQDRLVTQVCASDSLCLNEWRGKIDFALAFAVVHEVPDMLRFFEDVAAALKPGAACLVAEPKGHVTRRAFETTLAVAETQGLRCVERPRIRFAHTALLRRGELASVHDLEPTSKGPHS